MIHKSWREVGNNEPVYATIGGETKCIGLRVSDYSHELCADNPLVTCLNGLFFGWKKDQANKCYGLNKAEECA